MRSFRLLLAAGLCAASISAQTQGDVEAFQRAGGKADALYASKRYGEAAAVLRPYLTDAQAKTLPGWASEMYNLACDEALAGQREAALATLGAAQADGNATDADHLAKDPDLVSLHGTEAFERILAIARSRDRLWHTEPGESEPYAADLPLAQKMAAVSIVWSEARFNFAFFERQPELDWNKLYMQTMEQVAATRSTLEFYKLLIRFGAALHDGHTNVYPPKELVDAMYAEPGMRTRMLGGEVVVTAVLDPALTAQGWRAGDVIRTIDGVDVQAYAKENIAPYVSSSTQQDRMVRVYTYGLLGGDVHAPMKIGVASADGQVSERVVARLPLERAMTFFRAEHASFRMLSSGYAYLVINEFEDDQGVKLLREHADEVRRSKGLIVDVRANGGGSTGFGYQILQMLTSQSLKGALQRTRDYVAAERAWGETPGWKDFPQESVPADAKEPIGVPVAVLTSAQTFSAAEDFVAAFDSMHRGITVGQTTGGSTGQPLGFGLPGGGSARVCTKNDRAPDGTVFEGVGLKPTITVEPTAKDVQQGRDPVLEKAAEQLGRGPL